MAILSSQAISMHRTVVYMRLQENLRSDAQEATLQSAGASLTDAEAIGALLTSQLNPALAERRVLVWSVAPLRSRRCLTVPQATWTTTEKALRRSM